jgi:RNA polymerase II subunit A small phosphatase-like protein
MADTKNETATSMSTTGQSQAPAPSTTSPAPPAHTAETPATTATATDITTTTAANHDTNTTAPLHSAEPTAVDASASGSTGTTSAVKSTSAATTTGTGKAAKGSSTPAGSKASSSSGGVWGKLKGVLLSCVGPSPAHAVELDNVHTHAAPSSNNKVEKANGDAATAAKDSKDATSVDAHKSTEASAADHKKPETSTLEIPSSHSQTSQTTPTVVVVHGPDSLAAGVEAVTNPTPTPANSPGGVVNPSSTATPPSPSHSTFLTASAAATEADEDVVLTPEKPEVLPEDETAGVTSGAVVPPGAANEHAGDHSHVSTAHSRKTTAAGAGDESEDDGQRTEQEDSDVDMQIQAEEDDEERLIMNGGAGIPIGPVSVFDPGVEQEYLLIFLLTQDGTPRPLLPPVAPHHLGRKCLVLDLDETLVHSSFKVRHLFSLLPFSHLSI